MNKIKINIGIVGVGTVGAGVLKVLYSDDGRRLAARLGLELNIIKCAVSDLNKSRKLPSNYPLDLLTADWKEVVCHNDVNLVVELMGGVTVAREVVQTALELGKSVVTANKALLSTYGEELCRIADKHQANIYYEASVAGGIPIIKVLREAFIANHIEELYGIVNGTCNYILTYMAQRGEALTSALADASKKGYAEADPSLDIEGTDSAHKMSILASLICGRWIKPDDIHTEGIAKVSRGSNGDIVKNKQGNVSLTSSIDHKDIKSAKQIGYTIKLLGIIKICGPREDPSSLIQVSVYPALVPDTHVIANVHDAFNAIFLKGHVVGDALFYGRGAGQQPTTSAVLSDLADAALDIKNNSNRIPPFVHQEKFIGIRPFSECVSRYYIRMPVKRTPGTLAKITAILSDTKIGIRSVHQNEKNEDKGYTTLILLLHTATNATMDEALRKMEALDVVGEPVVKIRVEDCEHADRKE